MGLAEVTFVWFGGLLLIGFVGFFAVLLAGLSRGVQFVARALGARASAENRRLGGPPRLCTQARCGHLNPGHARFCARCGSRLAALDADRYG